MLAATVGRRCEAVVQRQRQRRQRELLTRTASPSMSLLLQGHTRGRATRRQRQRRLGSRRAAARHTPLSAQVASLSSELCRTDHELAFAPAARAHPGDIASIGVQFGYTPTVESQLKMLAVPDGARCSHGFPQAFVYAPFGGKKPNAGGCRLSCPLLVQAADDLENRGGLREFRKQRLDVSQNWRTWLRDTNLAHAAHRCSVVGVGEAASAKQTYGRGFVRRLLRNGVAGMSIYEADDATKRHDVKCFHAHLADWICRVREQPTDELLNPPSSRIIGRAIAAATAGMVRGGGVEKTTTSTASTSVLLPMEEERTASLFGLRGEGLRCWTACDPNHAREDGDYTYEATKNQIKLMRRRKRRNEAKAQRQVSQSTMQECTIIDQPTRH